jgi:acyl-CoA synthetase (NDP forming)
VASLQPILAPASLAVVGATSAGSLGGAVLQNILAGGFQGVATPVGRNGRPLDPRGAQAGRARGAA